MVDWYQKVTRDITELPNCIDFFENELDEARSEIILKGTLERASSVLPAIVETRFAQLQTIEGILEILNIDLRQLKSRVFRKYLESYQRQLSSRDAQAYVEGEQEVVDQAKLINELALLRNQWLGVLKALEAKQFQINNIVKLRVAGLEDTEINVFYGNPNR